MAIDEDVFPINNSLMGVIRYNLRLKFVEYLNELDLSAKTLKNYKSDLNHFLNWMLVRIERMGAAITDISEVIPYLSKSVAAEYRKSLVAINVPPGTLNRRLSTLRHLGNFLAKEGVIASDFTQVLVNVARTGGEVDFLDKYRQFLASEGVSKNTIKNYLSDIRQFLNYANNQSYTQS